MFTSLNVVRIAAVDCDSTSRSAIRARSRDIGTRCSGRDPCAVGDGARVTGSRVTGSRGAGACGAGGGDGLVGASEGRVARVAIASATSLFVMRPPRPVPATLAGSTPCSAIILRAAGNAVTLDTDSGAVDADA